MTSAASPAAAVPAAASPVIILGCGAAKRDLEPGEQVEIVDLYTGPLYRARLAYARALGGPHWVVSGLHGLRRTDYLVGTYEHDLRRESARERDDWANRVAVDVQRLVDPGAPIVVLASGPYLAWIRRLQSGARSWGRPSWPISVPAEGLPLGKQRRWLAQETARIEAERAPDVPDADASDDLPSYEADAAEVMRDLPSWQDDEPVEMRVGALRALLAAVGVGVGGGRTAA